MKIAVRILVCLFWCVLVVDHFAIAQESSTLEAASDQESIDRGGQLMLEVARQYQLLPNRWAALVDYHVEATPDAEDFRTFKGYSYTVEDKALKARVLKRQHSDELAEQGEVAQFQQLNLDWYRGNRKLRRFNDEWVPIKGGENRPYLDPLGAKNKVVQRTSAKWKENKQYGVFLPVEVNSNWMNNDESYEATFTIRWLFEKQVPDSAFVDPTTEKLVILDFPD